MPDLLTNLLGTARPIILGWDIAGEVVETSGHTHGIKIGDAVIVLSDGKGYAEYVAVPASSVAIKPANISFEEAAAVPIAGMTAWQPLVNRMTIKPGDTVLIHSGAGGVGHYGIQIAKYLGATVITTVSAKNRDFVLSLGADKVIDYTKEKFENVAGDVNFVLDTVGLETLTRSIELVKEGGTIVTVCPPVTEEQEKMAAEKNVNLILSMSQGDGDDLRRFAELMGKGVIKTHIAAIYPFEHMMAAHDAVETRRTAGKIVVKL
jgi:NADPH:quinone reductase-like Zn-dependent oxidoreductase